MIDLVRNDIPACDSVEWKTNWNEHFDTCFKWFDDIQRENQMSSIWSLFEVRDFTAVPFPDATKMVYADHWGEKHFEVELPEKPTWLDLWIAADSLIKQSGDCHHSFIDAFEQWGNNVLSLSTGS